MISVIVPYQEKRKEFYNRWCLPSIDSNELVSGVYKIDGKGLPAGKRNKGAKESIEDYIFFCDDDIILAKDCLEILYKELVDADFAYCDYWGIPLGEGVHQHYDKPWLQNGKDWSLETLKMGNYISPMTLFKKQSFLDSGGFDETLETLEDWDLFMRMGKMGMRGVYVPKILFHAYYFDPEGLSTRTTQDDILKLRIRHGIL